jgi:nucleoside-diphosphate-sugar epimerase
MTRLLLTGGAAAVADVASSLRAPLASHAANATGTLMVLEVCRRHGVGHVVAASSSAVYGANPATPVHEREWVRPLSPYGVSKLAMEQYLLAYQSCYGLSTLAFRFFNVSVSGVYPDANGRPRGGKTTPVITWGHSRDHRPDLKQLVWILTVAADGSVPIAYRLADGNTNDDPPSGLTDQRALKPYCVAQCYKLLQTTLEPRLPGC